jgi:TonB-linked SusC/RagA family outer membrane protein
MIETRNCFDFSLLVIKKYNLNQFRMRIYKLLLIFICLLTNVSLNAQQTQPISLSIKNDPLETALGQIRKQTGITFFYDKEILKIIGNISIRIEKADIQTVLKQIFRHTSVSYIIEGNVVVLSNKKEADRNITMDSSFLSKGGVHGFIYNTHQEGLGSASVIIKRSHQGTITNAKGEFTLDNVRINDTLSISFIAYETQYIPVWGRKDLSVVLKETKNELDQVVVQAYGTTTKRLEVGEIDQVNAKDIERQPISNPILALKGLVPGLLITPTSGFSNGPVRVEIRGRNSIDPNQLSDPLYIIDGMPLIQPNISYSPAGYQSGSAGLQQAGITPSLGQSPFAMLNPDDIESISVLKDAAATAIYGSRAGNGVIIITTKKGKPGATQFNINVSQDVNKTIGRYDLLSTSQYLQMRREALKNDGITPSIAAAPDLALWDTSRNVDWQKQLWRSTNSTVVRAGLSGGNNLTTFRLSGNYNLLRDISTLSDANKNQQAGASLNLTHHSVNQKLSVMLGIIYGYNNVNQVNPTGSATLAPNLPPIFDKNGNLNYADWDAAGLGYSFPFASLLQPSISSSNSLNSTLQIDYQLIKGLGISVSLGYNSSQNTNSNAWPIVSQDPLTNPTGSQVFGSSTNTGWNINPQVGYSHYIGKLKINVLAGATLNRAVGNGLTTFASGYTSDALIKSLSNAPSQLTSQNYAQDKYFGLLSRINLNWEDKYVLEFSGNRDGSSDFGPGRQFGNFGVVGFNWIASQEKWLKNILPSWVSFIKLNGSYGTTGVAGGAYQYLSQWATSTSNIPLYNYGGVLPLVPVHAVNQDYHWETDKALNAAFTLGLLNDRFTLHAAIYRKRVDDQLSQLPTPIFTGFTSIEGNSKANVQNTGVELSLNANLISSAKFSWTSSINLSHNDNKLLAYPGLQYSPYYLTYKVGQSLNTVYLLHYTGIDPQTGQRSYKDFNHDGVITNSSSSDPPGVSDDRGIAIDLSPKLTAGVVNNFRYSNFSFSFQFTYEKLTAQSPYTGTPGGFNYNVPAEVLNNHWQKPGDTSPNSRFTTIPQNSDQNFASSDGGYTDGSFLRLQNLIIGYFLPEKMAKRFGMHGLTLSISMQNIFTFSKYPGIDPELPFGGQPQPKIFSGKLSLTF